jgi:hypothetical protein
MRLPKVNAQTQPSHSAGRPGRSATGRLPALPLSTAPRWSRGKLLNLERPPKPVNTSLANLGESPRRGRRPAHAGGLQMG